MQKEAGALDKLDKAPVIGRFIGGDKYVSNVMGRIYNLIDGINAGKDISEAEVMASITDVDLEKFDKEQIVNFAKAQKSVLNTYTSSAVDTKLRKAYKGEEELQHFNRIKYGATRNDELRPAMDRQEAMKSLDEKVGVVKNELSQIPGLEEILKKFR